MVLQSERSNVPTSNCLFPAASEAAPVNSMYFNILFCVLLGILEDDPANPELILTARGTCYLFQRIVDSMIPEGS